MTKVKIQNSFGLCKKWITGPVFTVVDDFRKRYLQHSMAGNTDKIVITNKEVLYKKEQEVIK